MRLSHHAFLVRGEGKTVLPLLKGCLKKEYGIDVENHPDTWEEAAEVFGIDEARQMSEYQTRKTLPDTEQLIFVSFNTMTREAQNALLKVLEEPTERTHIFLITPHASTLLPTLQSRLSDTFSFETLSESSVDAGTFLHASLEKRLSLIEPLVKEKNTHGADTLLSGLIALLHEKRENLSSNRPLLESLQKITKYTTDPAVSLKMILEHVALTTPVI